MADTGAPWNIPFAEPSDLVRDWPGLSEDVADAVAAGLTAAGNAGIGSNVVSVTKTDPFSQSVGAGGVTADVSGLTATITPSSDTSKILVLSYTTTAASSASSNNNRAVNVILRRDSSDIFVGTPFQSRRPVTAGGIATATFGLQNVAVVVLDSPGTSSPVSYSVRLHNGETGDRTMLVNRVGTDNNDAAVGRATSSITLIEVSA